MKEEKSSKRHISTRFGEGTSTQKETFAYLNLTMQPNLYRTLKKRLLISVLTVGSAVVSAPVLSFSISASDIRATIAAVVIRDAWLSENDLVCRYSSDVGSSDSQSRIGRKIGKPRHEVITHTKRKENNLYHRV